MTTRTTEISDDEIDYFEKAYATERADGDRRPSLAVCQWVVKRIRAQSAEIAALRAVKKAADKPINLGCIVARAESKHADVGDLCCGICNGCRLRIALADLARFDDARK